MAFQDWMLHGHIPKPRTAERYPEETLWTLTKDERIAQAFIRRLPTGRDLICRVDGRWRNTQLFKEAESAHLLRLADEWNRRFRELGWTDAS